MILFSHTINMSVNREQSIINSMCIRNAHTIFLEILK